MKSTVCAGSRNQDPAATNLLARLNFSSSRCPSLTDFGVLVVADGSDGSAGGLKCVFATDQSATSTSALERFLDLGPMGIEEITVFTAIEPTNRMEVANLHRHLADQSAELHDARAVALRGEEIASLIEAKGIRAVYRMRTGHVPHQIDTAMRETGSELLILASKRQPGESGEVGGHIANAVLHSATYPILMLAA